ncbi:hypothetical protein BCR43DRAFT_470583 [Syncephalastrum racemosum]|uniref:Uncharacterized protein n=1 Tax=Syncephalastrum racemosum TaxID=13706 RepID=A0A1X2HQW0_SYNRA|nr:hypothetical protein BCR43DRAFT_470583 [Syncephalastrum racemosum]
MKFSVLIAFFVAFILTVARADDLQDEIDAAMKKFCGGIEVTGPSKGQVFTDPKKIKVTVTRKPNAQAKVIKGVDVYSIGSNGKAKYLGTPSNKQYSLNKKASLTVDLTKAPHVSLPGQFEFRVWVHNTAGPDCTLMSKTFKVKSSSHSNAAEDEQVANMDENIDRGCFGIELTSPEMGSTVNANKIPTVITRDGSSPVDTITSMTLFSVDFDTKTPKKIQDSYTGTSSISNVFTYKDSLKSASEESGKVAYFYKIESKTQHDENCEFYSHPFYLSN